MAYTKTFAKITGDTVETTDLSTECDNLEAEFNNQTGHAHDGTSGEGPVIGLIGDAGVVTPLNRVVVDSVNDRVSVFIDVASSPVEQLRIEDGVLYPSVNNDFDLGDNSYRFRDGYFYSVNITSDLTVGGNAALTTGDVGSVVQAYDADTAKLDVTQTWTANQTFKTTGTVTTVTLDTDAGQDASLLLAEGGVKALLLENVVGASLTGLFKYAADGSTVVSELRFYETGTIDLQIGTLQLGGSNALKASDIGSTVQAYNANNALTSDVTYERLNSNGDVGYSAGQVAYGNHVHTGVYQPYNANTALTTDITYEQLNTAGDVGPSAGQLAIGNHNHSGVYEPANASLAEVYDITYEQLNTNGDVGTGAGQLAIGNHTHTGVYEPADAAIAKTDEATNFTAGLQSGGVDVATTLYAYKSSATARTSTTTSADPDLAITSYGAGTYLIKGEFTCGNASSQGIRVTISGADTFDLNTKMWQANSTTLSLSDGGKITTSYIILNIANTFNNVVEFTAIATTSGSPTLALSWASDAGSSTSVYKGWMSLDKLA